MTEQRINSELTDGERKALAFHHLRATMAKKAVLDAAREGYKTARKQAKADGMVLADLDFMIRCSEIEDEGIVTDEIKRKTEIASWFNLPVLFQPDLFADRMDAQERITGEGEIAGLAGKNGESPYEKASQEDGWWLAGWRKGQDAMLKDFASAMEKKGNPIGDGDPFPETTGTIN